MNIIGPGSAELGTILKYSLYIFKKLVVKLWFYTIVRSLNHLSFQEDVGVIFTYKPLVEKLKGIQEVLLLQVFLLVYTILLHENKELIFPSTSSVNSNWFPLNCGCSLAHSGSATLLEKLSVTGWGRDTKKHLIWSKDGAVQGAVPPPSALPPSLHSPFSHFCFPSSFSPFPLVFPRPDAHWADAAGAQREVTPGFGLHCHVHRKHRIGCFCVSDEAQALGMIVAICRALWWCNQHERVATSAVLESNKSIPAFPVSSFIC